MLPYTYTPYEPNPNKEEIKETKERMKALAEIYKEAARQGFPKNELECEMYELMLELATYISEEKAREYVEHICL